MSNFPEVSSPFPLSPANSLHPPQLDDDFGASTGAGGGTDWLAREREMLGDTFGDAPANSNTDFDHASSAFPSLDDDDEDSGFAPPVQQQQQPQQQQQRTQQRSDFVNSFERDPVPAPNVSVTGHDELSAFENQFPEVDTAPAPPPAQVR